MGQRFQVDPRPQRQVLQVLRTQARQGSFVNLVLAECRITRLLLHLIEHCRQRRFDRESFLYLVSADERIFAIFEKTLKPTSNHIS
jgi:hypothetical protein